MDCNYKISFWVNTEVESWYAKQRIFCLWLWKFLYLKNKLVPLFICEWRYASVWREVIFIDVLGWQEVSSRINEKNVFWKHFLKFHTFSNILWKVNLIIEYDLIVYHTVTVSFCSLLCFHSMKTNNFRICSLIH